MNDGEEALATVTVTFNPDLDILKAQLERLPGAATKVIVDNASSPPLRQALRELAANRGDVTLVENPANLGLAAAINVGLRELATRTDVASRILLLDQDTEPEPGSIEQLLSAHRALSARDCSVAAVGPRLRDVDTALEHGFHQKRGWRIARRHPAATDPPLEVLGLNGSGMLLSTACVLALGGMDEDLFIDHVDTEWSFRLRAAGYRMFGVPGAVFLHRMGAAGLRYWFFGWRVWPCRAPVRHYYLFRNTVRLLRMKHVERVWKAWAPAKLALTMAAHLIFDRARVQQARQMFRGVRDGLRPTPGRD